MKALALVAALAVAGCSSRSSAVARQPSSVDDRISYYNARVTENPRLYPVWVQLGDAYFDKAKQTSEVAYLVKAHEAADRSLAMQETFHGYHLKARLFGHTHRFEEALVWAKKAQSAAVIPPDPMINALEVEMLVGAGKLDEAKGLLPQQGAPVDNFYKAAAIARVANVEHRFADAAAAYVRAGELAAVEKARPLVAWAEAMAGGMLADSGDFAAALPHLDASKDQGGCAEEQIHRAEVLAATGKPKDALAAYDRYLARTPDPAVFHAAYKLARTLGDAAATKRYYDAAVAGYRKVVDAGEVYTLGGLAQLLLDADGDAREALVLAEKNVKYKRDPEAQHTLAEARRRTGVAVP